MEESRISVRESTSIVEAIEAIDANNKGTVVVVDEEGKLVSVVTDGDIRRAILQGIDLKRPLSCLLEDRRKSLYPNPIFARVGDSREERIRLMRRHKIRHLPLVAAGGEVTDFVTSDELTSKSAPKMKAVVMAGGYGKRLRPLTESLPKPMLPLGDKPLLERLVEQLGESEIEQIYVTTHYHRSRIKEHFGDGSDYNVKIEYIDETSPMGTAGSLALLPPTSLPVLVINGDILTRIDFRTMHEFHREHQATLTVAVREHRSTIPYGVVRVNGTDVINIVEKPTSSCLVNAGIYLINPSALSLIQANGNGFDMPDLIRVLIAQCRRVVSFPIREYWADIGRIEDYERVKADVDQGRY